MKKFIIFASLFAWFPAFSQWQSVLKLEPNVELFIGPKTFQKKEHLRSVEILLNEPQKIERKSLKALLIFNCKDKKFRVKEMIVYEKINAEGRAKNTGDTDWMGIGSNDLFGSIAPALCAN